MRLIVIHFFNDFLNIKLFHKFIKLSTIELSKVLFFFKCIDIRFQSERFAHFFKTSSLFETDTFNIRSNYTNHFIVQRSDLTNKV